MGGVQKPHVAIIPSPGMGHLIPLSVLANRLDLNHGFSVTFLVPTDGSPMKPQKSFLDALRKTINVVYLPPANFDDLPDDARAETRIALSVNRSLQAIRDSLTALAAGSTRFVALIVDVFGTDALDVAQELGVSRFIFFTSSAMTLSFSFHLPRLDQTCECEYRDLPEPVKIPGCVPVASRDLPDPVQDRKDEAYRWILHHSKRNKMADGILVNSFLDLEPGAFSMLMGKDVGLVKPGIYPVGPLILTHSRGDNDDGSNSECHCLRWLDENPSQSVLFISFGSGGTLSQDQITELAMGLEMSEQRFIWVLKSPHEKASNGTFFSSQISTGTGRPSCDEFDYESFLPKGFVERTKTKRVGLLVPWWAPQTKILSHGSTGGFLSHCGWNSILESIVHGVPLIAWPLYAEQKMNVIMLTDDLKVALRVKRNGNGNGNGNGVVGREEIAKCVRGLMEGEEGKRLRERMRDLKDAAAVATSQSGHFTMSLAKVAQSWEN